MCIGCLTKYLTKHVADCRTPTTDAQVRHATCSPTCANWLRYGIQPKNARPNQPRAPARARPTSRK